MNLVNIVSSKLSFKKGLSSTALVFILIAVIVRIAFLFCSDNGFNGDSATRLYFCCMWYHSPSVMVGYDWLPLHFYLLGAPMYLLNETVWTPRIITLIFGILSAFPLFFLTKRIFGDNTALLSLLIFALLPAHIVLSVVSLSEVPFIFFLLCAFYYAFEYIETRSYRDLLLTVLFLLLINFIRFEGWLFSLLILFVLIESKMSLRALIIYLSPISALILFVLIISRQMTGDAFWGLNESDRFVKNSLIGIDPLVNAKDIPDAFVAFGIVFFPIGIVAGIKSKSAKRYLFLLAVPLIYTLYKVLSSSLTGQYRYFITSSILSIPFIVLGINLVISFIVKKQDDRRLILAAIVCVLLCLGHWKKVMIEPLKPGGNGKFYTGFISSALWVKENLKDSRVVVDDDFFSTYLWMVYADKIGKNNRTYEKSYTVETSPDCWKDSIAISTKFYRLVKENKVTHIVLFKNGNIASHLNFHDQVEKIKDLQFKKIYSNNGYYIYETM